VADAIALGFLVAKGIAFAEVLDGNDRRRHDGGLETAFSVP
jgi:hypothetical protein